MWTSAFFILALTALSTAQSIDSPFPSRTTIIAQSNNSRSNATIADHIRTHSQDRTVLGYVTPWNPRGTSNAEKFRGKFDIIAPAWHTVDVVHVDGKTTYEVGGGMPSKEDEEWVRRMQNPAKDGEGRTLPQVNISPRYVLDRFTPEDLVELLGQELLMEELVREIMESVDTNGYDGVVFECAAIWAVEPLIRMLADQLHEKGRTIVTVIPALRQDADDQTEQANKIAMHGMKTLSPIVDYIMVMTYDHAGQQGLAFQDVYDVNILPPESPLRQDGVRCPGPNTPLDYLTINAEQLSGDLEALLSGGFVMQSEQDSAAPLSSKMLMGLPLYGYTYSVGWFDQHSNSSLGVARIPPSSPIASKDNDTAAQASSREKATKREEQTSSVVPVLRFPGEPFKHDDLIEILKKNKALIRIDEASQEQYFDYVATLPPSKQPKVAEEDASSQKPLASYYRAYFPSAHTMFSRLNAMHDFPGMGIALWDLGQCGEWLLQEL
ncbi:hypothetical protein CBS101457_004841 [Exobasidium rhododendri]|nr:hypothetical protein CBS101457_004841 [Exobasidium rhododendri]